MQSLKDQIKLKGHNANLKLKEADNAESRVFANESSIFSGEQYQDLFQEIDELLLTPHPNTLTFYRYFMI